MVQELDWNSIGGTSSGSSNGSDRPIPFLKFQKDYTHLIRPVGKAVEFYKFFINREGERAVPIIVDPENRDKASQVISEHSGEENKGQQKFAMFVIDREDGRIKVLEGGNSIFNAFAQWAKINQIHPGQNGGGDFSITVTGEGYAGNNPRRYLAGCAKSCPVSEDERKMIKEKEEFMKWSKIYEGQEMSPSDIVEKVFNKKKEGSQVAAAAPTSSNIVDF